MADEVIVNVQDVRTWVLNEEFCLETLFEALESGASIEDATELAILQKN